MASETSPLLGSSKPKSAHTGEDSIDDAGRTVNGMRDALAETLRRRGYVIAAEYVNPISGIELDAYRPEIIWEPCSGALDHIFPSKIEQEPSSSAIRSAHTAADVPSDPALFVIGALHLLEGVLAVDQEPSPLTSLAQSLAMQERLRVTSDQLAQLARIAFVSSLTILQDAPSSLPIQDLDRVLIDLLWRQYPVTANAPSHRVSTADALAALLSSPPMEPYTLSLQSFAALPAMTSITEHSWNSSPQTPSSKSFWSIFDRLAQPCLFHAQCLVLHTLYLIMILHLALSSEYKHYHHINPLVTWGIKGAVGEKPRGSGRQTFIMGAMWWLFVVVSIGWGTEVCRAIIKGPLRRSLSFQSGSLPAGSLPPLIGHSLVTLSVFLRLFSMGKTSPVNLSYTMLAWSLPFLGASICIFPSGLPNLNPSFLHLRPESLLRRKPSHQPPTGLPNAALLQRVVSARLSGLRHTSAFLLLTVILLSVSLSGQVDIYDPESIGEAIPDLLGGLLPGFLPTAFPSRVSILDDSRIGRVAPMEARSSLVLALLFGLVTAWIAGGKKFELELERGMHNASDQDSYTLGYGSTIARLARLDRVRVVRYFSYDPRDPYDDLPLASPLNLPSFFLKDIPCTILKVLPSARANRAGTRWKASVNLWIWRLLVAPGLIVVGGFTTLLLRR
ncbi:uncharacterized protein L969DRAFT_48153 [Mixia osmundae IAM 14324]|uniref:Uncharacterized protein n=1 Tax=Mixia osmundae (strain CBS 9802 / IAM 14324 / JCM 22182 / KY 12970) TaxID=764103 RepID=G7E957_MIXOS|nr:uncharacterized protein L969DRAFT_48153 [Mixia osmundae IAM 14324]KEI39796.1 hypothetical protein L969DRAFT_48153 [Mixia osmundae IAM 14324]GAA99176.1 hypothetical protein E5Q_05868 [Mixia osmundae IAM 14324]